MDWFLCSGFLGNKVNKVQRTTCELDRPCTLRLSSSRKVTSLLSILWPTLWPPSLLYLPLGKLASLKPEYLKQVSSSGPLHQPFLLPGRPLFLEISVQMLPTLPAYLNTQQRIIPQPLSLLPPFSSFYLSPFNMLYDFIFVNIILHHPIRGTFVSQHTLPLALKMVSMQFMSPKGLTEISLKVCNTWPLGEMAAKEQEFVIRDRTGNALKGTDFTPKL